MTGSSNLFLYINIVKCNNIINSQKSEGVFNQWVANYKNYRGKFREHVKDEKGVQTRFVSRLTLNILDLANDKTLSNYVLGNHSLRKSNQ